MENQKPESAKQPKRSCSSAEPQPSLTDERYSRLILDQKQDIVDMVDSYLDYDSVIPVLSDLLETHLKAYPSSLTDGSGAREIYGVLRLIAFLGELKHTHEILIESQKRRGWSHE